MPTLYQAVEANRAFKGTALTFMGHRISYSEFIDFVDVYASKLYAAGIRKDTVVALISPNIPETIYAFYALNKIGARQLIVHPLIPDAALAEALKKCGADILLLPDARAPFYRESATGRRVIYLSPRHDLPLMARPFYPLKFYRELKGIRKGQYLDALPLSDTKVPVCMDDRKPSVYLRSGGTTGDSKTIVLNDFAINRIAFQAPQILEMSATEIEGTKMLGVLPLFHGFGLAMGMHAPLVNRAVSALMLNFNARQIVTAVRKKRLNYIILIPYMARKILADRRFNGPKLCRLTHAFIGADKTDLKIFEEFDSRMKKAGSKCRLLEGYGLTETVTVNFVNPRSRRKIGSVGLPLDGAKARIVDEEGHELPPGQCGQIEVATEMLMLGYLDDPAATSSTLARSADGTVWLKTGDIGYLDEDGYLFFRQRSKEVYKIAGMNVFPGDIERLALEFPEVKDAAAVFVPGEHPYVTLFLESAAEPEKLVTEVKKLLGARLIKYSRPEKIVVLPAFPRTNVGKTDRTKLAKSAVVEAD